MYCRFVKINVCDFLTFKFFVISEKQKSTRKECFFAFGLPERVCSQARRYRRRYANLRHSASPSCKVELCDKRKTKKHPQGVLFCFWPTRKDSNLRPSESESDALSSCATGRNIKLNAKVKIALKINPSEFATHIF